MPITEIKRMFRPNTDVEFFNLINDPIHQAYLTAIQPYKDAGKFSFTRDVIDNGLTMVMTNVYADLETLSEMSTLFTIELDNARINYLHSNNFGLLDYTQASNRRHVHSKSGIDQPFKVTTTYTFPPESAEFEKLFADALCTYEQYDKQTDLLMLEDGVQVVHEYLNAADYSDFSYSDLFYVPQLYAAGATRTIKFELV